MLAYLFQNVQTLRDNFSVTALLACSHFLFQLKSLGLLKRICLTDVELLDQCGDIVAVFALKHDHLSYVRTKLLETQETSIDAQWFVFHCHFLMLVGIILWQLLLIDYVLEQVLCVANFERELMLESLDKGTEQICIGLFEG